MTKTYYLKNTKNSPMFLKSEVTRYYHFAEGDRVRIKKKYHGKCISCDDCTMDTTPGYSNACYADEVFVVSYVGMHGYGYGKDHRAVMKVYRANGEQIFGGYDVGTVSRKLFKLVKE